MSIQMQTIAVPAAYAGAPDMTITFEPRKITFINEDTTLANAVIFSFDGINDAGKVMGGGNASSRYECWQRQQRVWVKRAAGAPNVTIIAEM